MIIKKETRAIRKNQKKIKITKIIKAPEFWQGTSVFKNIPKEKRHQLGSFRRFCQFFSLLGIYGKDEISVAAHFKMFNAAYLDEEVRKAMQDDGKKSKITNWSATIQVKHNQKYIYEKLEKIFFDLADPKKQESIISEDSTSVLTSEHKIPASLKSADKEQKKRILAPKFWKETLIFSKFPNDSPHQYGSFRRFCQFFSILDIYGDDEISVADHFRKHDANYLDTELIKAMQDDNNKEKIINWSASMQVNRSQKYLYERLKKIFFDLSPSKKQEGIISEDSTSFSTSQHKTSADVASDDSKKESVTSEFLINEEKIKKKFATKKRIIAPEFWKETSIFDDLPKKDFHQYGSFSRFCKLFSLLNIYGITPLSVASHFRKHNANYLDNAVKKAMADPNNKEKITHWYNSIPILNNEKNIYDSLAIILLKLGTIEKEKIASDPLRLTIEEKRQKKEVELDLVPGIPESDDSGDVMPDYKENKKITSDDSSDAKADKDTALDDSSDAENDDGDDFTHHFPVLTLTERQKSPQPSFLFPQDMLPVFEAAVLGDESTEKEEKTLPTTKFKRKQSLDSEPSPFAKENSGKKLKILPDKEEKEFPSSFGNTHNFFKSSVPLIPASAQRPVADSPPKPRKRKVIVLSDGEAEGTDSPTNHMENFLKLSRE